MATIGEINVRIGASLESLQKGLAQTERLLRRSGAQLSRIGEDLSFSLTAPLAAIGGAAIKVAGDMQALENSLIATMGSADAAQKELKELQRIAQLPGINLEQAVKGSVRLQAVGLGAGTARAAIENFANAVTLAGGTSADLDGVTLALTQIISKGKVSAEEINQIAERVPQIRAAMKNAFGTADTEVLQKMKIDAQEFVEVVTAEMGKLPKASGGIRNAIENAGMAVQEFLARIGADLNKTFNLEQVAKDLATNLSAAIEWFSNLDDSTRKLIYTTAGLLAAIGPVLKVYGVFKTVIAQAISVLNTAVTAFGKLSGTALSLAESFGKLDAATKRNLIIGLAALALAVGAGIKQWYDYSRAVNAAEIAQVNVKAAVESATVTAGKEIATLGTLIKAVKETSAGTIERKKAVEALKSAYPDYLQGQNLEKASLQKLTVLQSDLTREILKSVAARQKAAALEDIAAKQATAMLRAQQLRAGAQATPSEALRIDTGEMIRAGGISQAVVKKLEADIIAYGQAMNQTAEDFDRAFTGIGETATNRGAATAKALKELGRGIQETTEGTNKYTGALESALNKGKEEESYLTWKRDMLKEVAQSAKELSYWQQMLTEKGINTTAIPTLKGPDLTGITLSSDMQGDVFAPFTDSASRAIAKGQEMVDLLKAGLAPVLTSAIPNAASATRIALEETNEAMVAFNQRATEIINSALIDGFTSLAEGLGNAIAGVKNRMSGMQLILGSFADMMIQLGKLAISTGVAAAGIKAALQTLNPIAAIAAGGALVALGSAVKAKLASMAAPALAKGGLAYGPTYAMVGDNRSAGVDPEVIAPLSKLRGMLQGAGMGGNLTGTLRADGKDLLLVIEQQQRMKGRTGR